MYIVKYTSMVLTSSTWVFTFFFTHFGMKSEYFISLLKEKAYFLLSMHIQRRTDWIMIIKKCRRVTSVVKKNSFKQVSYCDWQQLKAKTIYLIFSRKIFKMTIIYIKLFIQSWRPLSSLSVSLFQWRGLAGLDVDGNCQTMIRMNRHLRAPVAAAIDFDAGSLKIPLFYEVVGQSLLESFGISCSHICLIFKKKYLFSSYVLSYQNISNYPCFANLSLNKNK